ncbi:MAG: hypothetical protein ACSHWU_00935 [Marinicella sp.]
MNIRLKLILAFVLCYISGDLKAVQINSKGVGEVLIYPYYTVNNDLNTLYSIVNTTDQGKALKVRFLEGENGQVVLDFNVYLSAFDIWTGALIPTSSTITGHVGERSVLHVSSDTSCVPFLNKSGQEFLPYLIDQDGPNDLMIRVRDGHFEVYELGVLADDAAIAVSHDITGIPQDCDAIEQAWISGDWSLTPIQEPTGGISGSASLVNVTEGLAFSFDASALDNFWGQAVEHTSPGSTTPNLDSAFPESRVLLANGQLAISEWSTGYEAVSAIFMNSEIYNEYAFDLFANGKTEWVLTFPTKSYHTSQITNIEAAPFSSIWTGSESCDEYSILTWDRSEQTVIPDWFCGGVPCPPRPRVPKTCYTSNVLEFLSPLTTAIPSTTRILGADNKYSLPGVTVSHATENGWARVQLYSGDNRMIPVSGVEFKGLPVTGFMVQQFTNAGAAQGLLAQYGSLFVHKGLVVTEEIEVN